MSLFARYTYFILRSFSTLIFAVFVSNRSTQHADFCLCVDKVIGRHGAWPARNDVINPFGDHDALLVVNGHLGRIVIRFEVMLFYCGSSGGTAICGVR
jgi:hypothetical protein